MAKSRPLVAGSFDDGIFNIGGEHGFLPGVEPLARLPEAFAPLQDVLDAMPVWLDYDAKTPGLLGTPGAIVAPVDALPDLFDEVQQLDPIADVTVIQALYRGYTFLASAYLLEPAHHGQTDEGYGKARSVLPAQIARPLVAVADILDVAPYLDYHYAYSLGNYVWKDRTLPEDEIWHWDNLGMAVRFTGTPDEVGFIMLHVHINAHSGDQVGSIFDAVAAAQRLADGQDGALEDLRVALAGNLAAMRKINDVRRQMWRASRPERYNDFRVFIMGITGNEALFGPGVVYEGVEKFGDAPQQFRGQTGAQDDIIPTADIFTGVTAYYQQNKLTDYLIDLRQYRPAVVREFFRSLYDACDDDFHAALRADPESAALLAAIVEQIYLFRNGHWQFVQRYILANTRHATATGGTPITTWLPNQIDACLRYMDALLEEQRPLRDTMTESTRALFDTIDTLSPKRRQILDDQLAELAKANYDVDLVYELNEGHYDEVS